MPILRDEIVRIRPLTERRNEGIASLESHRLVFCAKFIGDLPVFHRDHTERIQELPAFPERLRRKVALNFGQDRSSHNKLETRGVFREQEKQSGYFGGSWFGKGQDKDVRIKDEPQASPSRSSLAWLERAGRSVPWSCPSLWDPPAFRESGAKPP